jgi:DNA-binding winged helix-turn-helix (wHTH) protein/tetratricopeptide (TPR) repeat protein
MSGVVFRFGRCEVDGARRQVVLDGQERPLEPRAFDALLYLLQNRHRVVSKEELLDAVWKHRHVSLGVISRAVSLIRKAIGDEGGDAPLVRTVHGVGLRFVGEISVDDTGSPQGQPGASPVGPAPGKPSHADAISLAVLPFENLTGDTGLDWVEFGLSSLTVHALERNPELAVVSLPALQKALAAVPATAGMTQRGDAVSRLLGVDLLVQVAIRHDRAGYRLDYSCGPRVPAPEPGTLRGADLITLADELASALRHAVSPASEDPPAGGEPLDSLSGEAFARAMQAVGEQKWKRASHLLRVALDMEPGNRAIQRELFACLATLGDESAEPLGRSLLDEAQAEGDPESMAFVHHMLGRCHAVNRRPEPAQRHLDQALSLSREHGPWEWSAMAMQSRFQLALHHGQPERAQQLMEVMGESWEHSANQCLRVNWLSNLSAMSWRQGNLVRSLHYAWAALHLSGQFNLAGDHASALLSLAVTSGELGMFQPAVQHGQEALAAGLSLAEPTIIARTACSLCWLYRETRSPLDSARIVASLDSAEFRVAANLPGLWMARGHHAAAAGRHDEAPDHWWQAVMQARRQEAPHAEYVALPWLLVALVQAGALEEAHRLITELRRRPDVLAYPRMVAALRHAEALARHAAGEREGALALLMEVADGAEQSHWRAAACMDAAWLQLAAGRLDLVRRLMRDLGSWLEEHPVGRMLNARRAQAEGQAASQDDLALAAALSPRWLPSRS